MQTHLSLSPGIWCWLDLCPDPMHGLLQSLHHSHRLIVHFEFGQSGAVLNCHRNWTTRRAQSLSQSQPFRVMIHPCHFEDVRTILYSVQFYNYNWFSILSLYLVMSTSTSYFTVVIKCTRGLTHHVVLFLASLYSAFGLIFQTISQNVRYVRNNISNTEREGEKKRKKGREPYATL